MNKLFILVLNLISVIMRPLKKAAYGCQSASEVALYGYCV